MSGIFVVKPFILETFQLERGGGENHFGYFPEKKSWG
jgi:hypothetical protein